MYQIGGNTYEVIKEHKNAWNYEAFRDRYSEVLERYDYVVGDWGYNQLRLKGFFKEGSPRATKESTIAGLQDYLHEYCNFGCAYFVLEKQNTKPNGRQVPGTNQGEQIPGQARGQGQGQGQAPDQAEVSGNTQG